MLAPERNREHSIGDQVVTLNVGFMERLPRMNRIDEKYEELVALHIGRLSLETCKNLSIKEDREARILELQQ
ncbi:hypothetical protein D3C77_761840 [compost metagenome]